MLRLIWFYVLKGLFVKTVLSKQKTTERKSKVETKAAIELKNITKTFGSVVANKDVNLTVNRGEILSILGENGSGKTTLIKLINGLLKPDFGSVEIYSQKPGIAMVKGIITTNAKRSMYFK